MKHKMQEEKITGSYSIPKSVREDLKCFSQFSNRTESEVITSALQAYFTSDKAFAELRAVEKSKIKWLQSFCEHESDYRNFIGNRDLLLGRSE